MEQPAQTGYSEEGEEVGVEGMCLVAAAVEDRIEGNDLDLNTSTGILVPGPGTNHTKLEVVQWGQQVCLQQAGGLLDMTEVEEGLVVSSALPFPHPSF